jgi:hypothetical protein
MKKHIALGLVASTLFLAGCCTSHHSTTWEYKTYLGGNTMITKLDTKLNELAAEGWTIQSFSPQEGQPGSYVFLLKRPKQ